MWRLARVYDDSPWVPARGSIFVSKENGNAHRCMTSLLTASYVLKFLTRKAYSCFKVCTKSLLPSSSSLNTPGMKCWRRSCNRDRVPVKNNVQDKIESCDCCLQPLCRSLGPYDMLSLVALLHNLLNPHSKHFQLPECLLRHS